MCRYHRAPTAKRGIGWPAAVKLLFLPLKYWDLRLRSKIELGKYWYSLCLRGAVVCIASNRFKLGAVQIKILPIDARLTLRPAAF